MENTVRLLLIEDDDIDQQAFVRLVKKKRLPYQYTIVNSLNKARHQLNINLFDIIICDYLLGDGTALDLISDNPLPPIIVVTGAGDEAIAVNAMKAGAKDYFVKDVQGNYLNTLSKAVENILRHIALEKAEHEQRVFADTLHQIARILNSTLNLDEILSLILEHIQRIIPHDSANIMLIENGMVQLVQHTGWTKKKVDEFSAEMFSIMELPHLITMHKTHLPYLIGDVTSFDDWKSVLDVNDPRAYLGAPICVDDEVIGFLNLDSVHANHFNQKHAKKLEAFVDQVAVAIKNARLYHDLHELTIIEERQRLARDLHDSVSQTLFASSIISNAIIKQWQRDPASIGDELIELRDLMLGALAEMRTLLFELRPNTLLETSLGDLIRQLLETVKGHTRLKIEVTVQGDCILPDDVHVAFFRIAQEAINNVIKHARATRLQVYLKSESTWTEMIIQDNGRGFDLANVNPHRFGIKIMKERAIEANITNEVASIPNKGTIVTVRWANEETQ